MQYICVTPWWRIMSPRGALYIVCSSSPSKESWGTPQVKRQLADRSLTMDTNCVLFLLGTMWTTDKPKWKVTIPKRLSSLWRRIWWSTVSDSADKSSIINRTTLLLSSIELRISFLTLNKAESVLWATLIYRPTGKAQVDCSRSDDWQLGGLTLFRIS